MKVSSNKNIEHLKCINKMICGGSENGLRIAPLTICYNGSIAKFNVSNDKANEILKFAKMSITNDISSPNSGDLPLPKITPLLVWERLHNLSIHFIISFTFKISKRY
uniref:Tify domain-containing protein n=1 Tax=Solanum lycopersicum TaxID=4081 RepID=A0A3Q7ETU8_SOLLC